MNTTDANSTFDQLDPWVQCFSSLAVMTTQNLNFLVGLPLNIYIIRLIRADGLDGSVIFIVNHALNDIFFILPTPLYLLCYFQKLCFLHPFLFFMSYCLAARFQFQCCVSLERYLAVVHPVVFRRYRDLKYRLQCSIVIWTYSLITGGYYTFYYKDMPYFAFSLVQTGIFAIMIFCCVSTLKVLRRPGPGIGRREDAELSTVKKRAFVTVCLNLVMFLMQMIPMMAVFFAFQMLSASSLALALIISFHMYVTVGYAQTLLFLYHFGKLTPLC